MHARYWKSGIVGLPWLQSPWHRMFLLGPRDMLHSAQWIARRLRLWSGAVARLPAPVAELLLAPTNEHAARAHGLPWTVFHGDLRPVNLALPPCGRPVAIDWGLLGAGPATFDVFWHLFASWQWQPRRHEDSLARYRQMLETALGGPVPEVEWAGLIDAGLLCGAVMSMGGLAEAVENGLSGAQAEWDWRVQQLERLV
jgi:hypothetical protein